jgi:hypothetical protein
VCVPCRPFVGIMCKLITVVINVLIWDKHATPAGIGFLLVWCVSAQQTGRGLTDVSRMALLVALLGAAAHHAAAHLAQHRRLLLHG